MTGNVVFLGISAATGDWRQVIRHVVPILAFFCGIIASRLIHRAPLRHAALLVLSLEIATLTIAGFLPSSFPELVYVATVAFVSAFQVTTFHRVGRLPYNSTFVTGNLRAMIEGLFDRKFAVDPAKRWQSRVIALRLAAICTAFLLGAFGGAFCTKHFPDHAILFALPTLALTLVLTLLRTIPDPAT